MSDHHDPHSPRPEYDPKAPKPPEHELMDVQFPEDEPASDDGVFIDLTEECTLDLEEIPDEVPPVQQIQPQAIPSLEDEPQSMIFEAEDDVELLEDDESPEGAIGFDLPEVNDDTGAVTRGVSREELEFLMASEAPFADPASFAGLSEAVPEAVLDLGEDVPVAESASAVGMAEAHDVTDLGEDIPLADSASAVGMAQPTPEAIHELADIGEDIPLADSASAVGMAEPVAEEVTDLGEDILFADSASAVGLPEAAAFSEVTEIGEDIPLADSASAVGMAEPVAEESPEVADLAGDILLADSASAVGMAEPVVAEESTEVADLAGDILLADSASAVGMAEPPAPQFDEELDLAADLPFAESASFTGQPEAVAPEVSEAADFGESLPMADGASFAGLSAQDAGDAMDFGEDVPMADSASFAGQRGSAAPLDLSELVPDEAPAAAASGSAVDLTAVDPVMPVMPASDWFSAPAATQPPVPENAPVAKAADQDAGSIFDAPAAHQHEGSDIFGWKRPEEASNIFSGLSGLTPRADALDLLPSEPFDLEPPPKSDNSKTPKVFINQSDAPDSARLNKPKSRLEAVEEIDTGATPMSSVDASSIMGELAGPDLNFNLDGSEVRLEDPGVERTLDDEDAAAIEPDSSWSSPTFEDDIEIEVVEEEQAGPGPVSTIGFADQPPISPMGEESSVPVAKQPEPPSGKHPWHTSPSSDLFAQHRTEAGPDSTRVNPLDISFEPDQPSLSSAQSSIFSDQHPPPGSESAITGGSANVRIGRDEEMTVFDNLDDVEGASHILGATGMPDAEDVLKSGPGSTEDDEEEDVGVDWLAASKHGDGDGIDFALDDHPDAPASGFLSHARLPNVKGPQSGIFSSSNLDPSSRPPEEQRTHEMDSAANLFGEAPSEALKSEHRKGVQGKPIHSPSGDVEVDWLAATDEPEAMKVEAIPFKASDYGMEDVEAEAEPAYVMASDDSSDSGEADSSVDSEEKAIPSSRLKKAEKEKKGGSAFVGGLVGGIGGILAGVAACAGLYMGGVIPNGSNNDTAAPVVVAPTADPKKDAELAQLRRDLQAERENADQKLKDAADVIKAKADQEVAQLKGTIEGFEINLKTAEADAKKAKDEADAAKGAAEVHKLALMKAEVTAREAMASVAGLEKAAKDAQDKAMVAETAAKKAADDLVAAMKDLDTAKAEAVAQAKLATDMAEKLTKSEAALAKADTTAKHLNDAIGGIAKELQDGKFLSADKADPAAVATAVKDAITRASGPNVASLVPSGASAIVGTGLTTAQLVDLSDRVSKSEAAAKAAADKLAKETTAIKTDYLAQIETLNKAHTDEVKKLTDAATADAKKAKDDQAAAIKELTDKLAADTAKIKEDSDAKIIAAQKKAAQDVAKVEASLESMKADLASVMTPTQALDLWLPLLSEARRASDSAPAIANADKVLKTAAPGSEEYAKALTVKALALLVKGDSAAAKTTFDAVKKDGGYAADKSWAKIADEGAAAAVDPVSRFRKPVDPERKDPRSGVRLLDDGIRQYTARRYADAEKLLAQSVANEAGNPVAWYFLGASRWQQGKRDAAKDDFRQGAEREALRTMSAAAVEQAIAPIQGPARAALSDARP